MFDVLTRRLFVRKPLIAKFSPIIRDAHGEPYDDESLTGLKRMFNSETIRGRANFAKLYLAMWTGGLIIYMLTKKKKKSESKSDTARSE